MNPRKGITVSTRSRALNWLAGALVALSVASFASPAFAATYDPLNVISYDTWRASGSMSVADIQAFLDAQTGPLKSLVTTDYAGIGKKSAARIIWEAAHGWNLNPKVILATLQKEQSLLTVSNSSNAARLVKAMGCGVYGDADQDGKTDNRFPGFGNQIWNGARVLSRYEITYNWFPGATRTVTAYKSVDATKLVDGVVVGYRKTVSYQKTIRPANASTFALYIYTPYYPQKLFWDVYVRYFGDPLSAPRMLPVYRFKSRTTGAYYYTTSEGMRYKLRSASGWTYGGVSFTVDASSTANTSPLYRLRNSRTGRYTYTTSTRDRDRLLAVRPRVWSVSGTVALVSAQATEGAAPVYRLENKRTRAILFTRYSSTKTRLTTGRSATFWYRGIAFYLGASEDSTRPVGP